MLSMMAYIEQIKHETIKLQAELCGCVPEAWTYPTGKSWLFCLRVDSLGESQCTD